MSLTVAGVLLAPRSDAATPLWGDLEKGPWDVGFSVIDTRDSTRGFAARHTFDGGVTEKETARPIRLYLWYPADSTGGPPVAYRYYRKLAAGPDASDVVVAALVQSERSLIARMTGHEFTPAGWDSLMAMETVAHLDATPATREFPVILSCTDARRNSVLFEYLASHGYIVITVPVKGRFTQQAIEFTPNPVSIESAVQDLQFAYGYLRAVPGADLDRLGMWTFSSLSIYSLEFQCRNMAARAMLHVEGWEGFKKGWEILDESAFYDPAALRAPYMLLRKEKEETSPAYANDSRIFDSLRYTTRYRVFVSEMEHGDFNSMKTAARATDEIRSRYEMACRITLAFYDAYLNDDAGAAIRLEALLDELTPNLIRYDHLSPAKAPPTEAELIAAFEAGGEEQAAAIERVMEILAVGMDLPYRERVLNRFGYRLMRERPVDAPLVFDIMTRAFPTSANAWDSRSDALETLGDIQGARESVTQALKILPLDKSLSRDQRERMEIDLREKLRRFREGN